MVRRFMLTLILALTVIGAGSALAAMAYHTVLLPENVRPQPVETGYAWGQATLIVNDEETHFNLTFNFAGLEAPQTAVKLLRASVHDAGMVLDATLPFEYYFHAGSYVVTADILEALQVENDEGVTELAIQVYDERYPGGAIRGNFRFVTVQVDAATWSSVKNLFN